MKGSDKEKIIAKVTSILSKEDDIVFVYLFGSFLTNYFKPGRSDLDIGIYFEKTPSIYRIHELQYAIEKELNQFGKIDIAQMQLRNLILNHEIFKKGKIVVNKDPDFHKRFKLSQWSQYIDFKISRRKLEEGLTNPILLKTKGKNAK